MAQEQRIRIEKAMGDLVDDVDKHSIRDMQVCPYNFEVMSKHGQH